MAFQNSVGISTLPDLGRGRIASFLVTGVLLVIIPPHTPAKADESPPPKVIPEVTPVLEGISTPPSTIVTEQPSPVQSLIAPPSWAAQGPGPSQNGQVENVSPNDEVSGAIHTVAAHPTNADILYIGATNGGVWKTTNATAASPTWTPLTDSQGSQSIGALELDPTDNTNNTILAGIGRYSSYAQLGGNRIGILKSTDAGSTWTLLNGGGAMLGRNISGLAPRGNTIVASVNVADSFTFGNVGIFRSTDNGANFTQISVGDGTATGLPGGVCYDLAGDPSNNAILYTSSIFADIVGGVNGVYKSTDTGATWTKVSDATMDALITNSTSNVEISVGGSDNVYCAIINAGNLNGLFRSGNGGTSWTQMDTPSTNENGTDVGLNPKGSKGPTSGTPEEIAGGQGAIHFSIRADPTNANIVYVGGDRQPRSFGDTGGFPNSIGATDFSGRLFRGNASAAAGSQFVHLTHSNSLGAAGGGTANSSSPHADSREMVFDANGNIIEVDDGGVYRRTNPQNNTGDWFSINGNIQVTEAHDVVYDPVSNTVITGNQDTGTTMQTGTGTIFDSVSTADGGDVAVDIIVNAGSMQSVRYSSFQNLGRFRRQVRDNSNGLVSETFPNHTGFTAGSIGDAQFRTPITVNRVAGDRLLFGGNDGVYESTNGGSSTTKLNSLSVNSFDSEPLVYGGRKSGANIPEIIYSANSTTLVVRGQSPAAIGTKATPADTDINDIITDPEDWETAFIIDDNQIFRTTNAGDSFTEVSGNIASISGGELFAVQFIADLDLLLVTGRIGVFSAEGPNYNVWSAFGTGFPTVPVLDLHYDPVDRVLVAGTMGRGAWLTNIPPLDYGDAPDTHLTLAASGGARHAVNTQIFMGANLPDGDSDGFGDGTDDAPTGDAADDDNEGTDDEDGVASFVGLAIGSAAYSVDVTVTNNTGSAATLFGWIDFDGDGIFQTDEGASTAVATGTSGGTATLTWTGLGTTVDISAGDVFARFRLTTDAAITTATPGGLAGDGEVEDYRFTIFATALAAWRADNFSATDLANPGLEATVWGNSANPDKDVWPNVFEFLFGLDPNLFNIDCPITCSTRVDGTDTFVTYSFPRRINRSGTGGESTLFSDAPDGTFVATPKIPTTAGIDSFLETVTYEDNVAIRNSSGTAPRFGRISFESIATETFGSFCILIGEDPAGGPPQTLTRFSVPVLQPRVASGTVTAKGSSTLTDSNAAYGALTANQFYVLITNGTDAGVRATISSNTTTQLNLASDLNSFDIIGSTYEIRKHATIGKLFGTNNSANLGEGANSSAADNVQVTLSGSGVETFYYSNGAPMGWKDSGDVDATNTVVDPIAGVTVARKVTGDRNLYLSGAVRLASVRADIATGNSTVTNPNSEGISLDDLNLFTGNASTGFVGGTNPLGNTDNLLVFNTDGSVSRYFWWTGTTPNGWADTTFTAAGTVVIPPGAAIVIQRKTANGTLQWSVPTAP